MWSKLSIEEIKWGIKILKPSKPPGNDGWTSEYYHSFSTDVPEIPLALSVLTTFLSIWVKPNFKKCAANGVCGILVKNVLHIKILKYQNKTKMDDEFTPITETIKAKFKGCLTRDLSILYRVLSKAEGMSGASHVFLSLDVTKTQCSNLDKIYSIIFRKTKFMKSEKTVLSNSLVDAGLGVLTFTGLNQILKKYWIKVFC